MTLITSRQDRTRIHSSEVGETFLRVGSHGQVGKVIARKSGRDEQRPAWPTTHTCVASSGAVNRGRRQPPLQPLKDIIGRVRVPVAKFSPHKNITDLWENLPDPPRCHGNCPRCIASPHTSFISPRWIQGAPLFPSTGSIRSLLKFNVYLTTVFVDWLMLFKSSSS